MTDIDFIVSVLNRFFILKEIRNHFEIIAEGDIAGSEPWVQVEFAKFIKIHCANEFEWHREHHILTDKRKNKKHTRMFIDFALRRKGFKKDRYILLELKYHHSPKTCISNMFRDLKKINSAMASSMDGRSLFVVGIHLKKGMTKTKIKSYIIDKEDTITRNSIITKVIRGTDYAFTVTYRDSSK